MDPDRNINIEPRNDNEETPLHYAALQGQLEVVKYLIFKVKNKKPMDKFGKTPLDRAQSNGHQDIVDFLLNPQGTIHILRRTFFTPPPSPCSPSLFQIRSLFRTGPSINHEYKGGGSELSTKYT